MESTQIKPGYLVTVTTPKGRRIRGTCLVESIKNDELTVGSLPPGTRKGDKLVYFPALSEWMNLARKTN